MKKKIFILGGNGGLGIEICKFFHRSNYEVYFTCRSLKKVNFVKKRINKSNIFGFKCDVLNENDLKKICKIILKNKIEIIVNSVGVFFYDDLINLSSKKFIDTIKLNTLPTILLNKYLALYKKKNDKVNIISLGSSSSYEGFKNTTIYCATKHALLGAIKSINNEKIKENIVNINLNPGSIKTKMGKKVKNQNYADFINPKELAEFILSISKIGDSFFFDDLKIKRRKIS